MEKLTPDQQLTLIDQMCRYVERYRDRKDSTIISKIANKLGVSSADVAGAIKKRSANQFDLISKIYVEYRKIEELNPLIEAEEAEKESYIDRMIDGITAFVQNQPSTAYDKLADMTGYYAFDIIGALNDPYNNQEMIENIYTACNYLQQQDQPLSKESESMSEVDSKTVEMTQSIKDYIKVNPTKIFTLAKVSEIPPQEIIDAINSENPDREKIEAINRSLQTLLVAPQVEMSMKY